MINRTKSRQAGYSIVEIAYVLTAISLVVTGAIWGFSKTIRNDQVKAEKEKMLAMHEAILAYAANHRTFGVELQFADYNTTNGAPLLTTALTPGRPFLPCPDLDGDGLEDRNIAVDEATRNSIGYLSNPDGEYPAIVDLHATNGRCLDTKGHLPWRTLGISQPSDYWGNYYTYWVDANFTHALFGFDQTTRGNYAFKHLAVPLAAGGYTYAVRADPAGTRTSATFHGEYLFSPQSSGLPSRATFPHSGIVIRLGESNSLTHSFNFPEDMAFQGITDGQVVVAGELLANNYFTRREQVEERVANHPGGIRIPVFEYRGLQTSNSNSPANFLLGANYSSHVLANGIAFAIVSHGPNGHGAAKYKINHDNGSGYVCNEFASIGATIPLATHPHRGEILNALGTKNCRRDTLRQQAACAGNGNIANPISDAELNQIRACARIEQSKAIFVTGQDIQSANSSFNYFDDIVTWMHPDELVQALTERDVLPLDLPPVALPTGLIPYDHRNNTFKF